MELSIRVQRAVRRLAKEYEISEDWLEEEASGFLDNYEMDNDGDMMPDGRLIRALEYRCEDYAEMLK